MHVQCTCTSHYNVTINFSNTDINECDSHTCVHGSCVDGIAEFTCNCSLGWTGPNCNTSKIMASVLRAKQHLSTCTVLYIQPYMYLCIHAQCIYVHVATWLQCVTAQVLTTAWITSVWMELVLMVISATRVPVTPDSRATFVRLVSAKCRTAISAKRKTGKC